ncbi:hypothetical protein MLD38_029562 [Melastoma candidum]|uniref:Uncharacterized protein n=1 Tax=Melastoma candidum TaxID=119954 RepID=A0ACB9N502_9MYRT|nr:hypothetical protein MLD38_029562 [Melastoma candidum]
MLAGCALSVPDGLFFSSCCVRNAVRSAVASLAPLSGPRVSVRAMVGQRRRSRRRGAKSVVVSCNLFAGSSGCGEPEDEFGDYLEASLLLEETVSHYRMRREGYQDGVKWQSSSRFYPFTFQAERPGIDQGMLSRFRNPTIFLKISFDGDYLLPITVGEHAVETFVEAIQQGEPAECPDQFQFFGDFTEKVDCNMIMVRLTKRVANTYYASIFFSEPGKTDLLSVDIRPLDAVNVAYRCKIPIFVHKQIILTDAVKLAYGRERIRNAKPVYDVTLDSAADGADILAKELDIVKNLNLAVKEERYCDAALWRDKLTAIRKSGT